MARKTAIATEENVPSILDDANVSEITAEVVDETAVEGEMIEMSESTDVHPTPPVTATKVRLAKKVSGINKTAALKMLVDHNPKRAGGASALRFEAYFTKNEDGTPAIDSVEKALAVGLTMGDIKYDIAHNFIQVEGVDVCEYEVTTRGARGPSSPRSPIDPDLAPTSTEGLLEEGTTDAFGDPIEPEVQAA